MKKTHLLLVAFVILLIIGVPATIIALRFQTHPTTKAAPSTTLSFSPSTQTVNTNDSFNVDVMVDPGADSIYYVKIALTYDNTKITHGTGGIAPNTAAFPTTVQGPTYDQCTGNQCVMSIVVSTDIAKPITSPTKVATINLQALASTGATPTSLGFGADSEVLDISQNNVLLAPSATDAITIQGNSTTAPTPTTSPIPTTTSTVSTPTDTPTPTIGNTISTSTPTTATTSGTLPATGPGDIFIVAGIGGLAVLIIGAFLIIGL